MERWHHRVLICLCAVFLTACETRPESMTLTGRPPLDPDQVRIYLTAPQDYEIVGIVEATNRSGLVEQSALDNAVDELKTQAAKIGANGVLLATGGENTNTSVSSSESLGGIPVTGNTLSGKAIFVSD